jgi:hypothetical protein
MTFKESEMGLNRSDADLQAIQTSVAFKNISDAVEQYRRQFGLAFLALIAFSAIHVGLVVIANLYTMQTRVSHGTLTDASDNSEAVATAASTRTYDLSFIMSNMDEPAQVDALTNMKSVSFVDRSDAYRAYTVTGFQLGGWKRSELKLYTSVGHVLEYVRGKGVRVFSENGTTNNQTRRALLESASPTSGSDSPTEFTLAPSESPTYMGWTAYKAELDHMLTTVPPQTSTSIKSIEIDSITGTLTTGKVKSDDISDMDDVDTFKGMRDHVIGNFALNDNYINTELPYIKAFASGLSDAAKTELNKEDWGGSVSSWETIVKKELKDCKVGSTSCFTDNEVDAYWNTAKHNSEVGAKEMAKGVNRWLTNGDTDNGASTPTESAQQMFEKGITDAKKAVADNSGQSTYAGMLYNSVAQEAARADATSEESKYISEFYSETSKRRGSDNWDTTTQSAISGVLTTVANSVDYTLKAYSQFKAGQYIGPTETGTVYTDTDTDGYGCGKSSVTTLMEYDSDPAVMAVSVCTSSGHMVGGYFFSEVLGTYEAFMVYVPTSYCNVAKTKTAAEVHGLDIGEFYLYFLHGWGQSAELLLDASPVISHMASTCTDHDGDSSTANMCLTADFITIAPEDGASPFGSKTWYVNVVNNGYHMDMIAFELPEFLGNTLGIHADGAGLFGFSMGGFGTASILMTYSGLYNAGAAFNAPLDAHICFVRNTCHLQCGVNPIYCELMWTSIQSAMNPYVMVKNGGVVTTEGYYDPVAVGVAVGLLAKGASEAKCALDTDIEGMIIASKSGKLKDTNTFQYNAFGSSVDLGMVDLGSGETYGSDYKIFDDNGLSIATVSWAANYYLDPIYFIISSAGYAVTHNPLTDERNFNTPSDVKPFGAFLEQMPLTRVRRNPTIWCSNEINTYFMVATDLNDEYGLALVADEFSDVISNDLGSDQYMQGGYIHDTYGSQGHTMSARDFGKAYQFFSDVFYTMKHVSEDGEEVFYHTYVCSVYLNPTEMYVVTNVGYLHVGLQGAATATPTTAYGGYAYLSSEDGEEGGRRRRHLLAAMCETDKNGDPVAGSACGATCSNYMTTTLPTNMSEDDFKEAFFDPTMVSKAARDEYADMVGIELSTTGKMKAKSGVTFNDAYTELECTSCMASV